MRFLKNAATSDLPAVLHQVADYVVANTPSSQLQDVAAEAARVQAAAMARLLVPEAAQEPDCLLTMPEVAERLRIQEETARELGRRRQLPTVRVGERFVRVRSSDLQAWIARGGSRGLR